MKKTIYTLFLLIMTITNLFSQQNIFPKLTGTYLGQKLPGLVPEIFAPGIISTGLDEGRICFSPDGKELYYGFLTPDGPFRKTILLYSGFKNGYWTEPKELDFNPDRNFYYQFISPDGRKIFFGSKRTEKPTSNIWYAEKTVEGWSEPKKIEFEKDYNGNGGLYPTVAANGNLYFQDWLKSSPEPNSSDIYMAKYENGKYLKPERLGDAINTSQYHECHPHIAPDESYIIFDADRPDGLGKDDLYISFRDKNGQWMKAQNMGDRINTQYDDRRAFVTLDGKYFFFVSFKSELSQLPNRTMTSSEIQRLVNGPKNGSSDFYWIDAKIIEEFRPKNN